MENFIIREATAEDAAALLEIYAYYVRNTATTFEYEPPLISAFTERIAAARTRYPYLLLESGSEVCGFAFAHAFRERPAYDYAAEVTIYLRHDMRHQALGRALYAALEDELRRMGVRSLYACVAVPAGEDMHLSMDSPRFHETMGFRRCGEFRNCGMKFGKWYTMVWMEKIIGSFDEHPEPLIPYPALLRREDRDLPEPLSAYDGRQVRLVTEQGEMFRGLCGSFPSGYGEYAFVTPEEGVQIEGYIFFKSNIRTMEPIG